MVLMLTIWLLVHRACHLLSILLSYITVDGVSCESPYDYYYYFIQVYILLLLMLSSSDFYKLLPLFVTSVGCVVSNTK